MRARIRHAAFTSAPVWLSRGRLARVHPDHCLTLTQRSLVMPDLPDALDGLKITHLSDLHIGRLITTAHLPHIIESARRCEGDLIAVTGDFVDLSLNVLDEVIAALVKLEAPLGVYLVPGNHDYLADGPELIRRFRDANLKLMLNESVKVRRDGQEISIAGIDYDDRPSKLARMVHRTVRTPRSAAPPGLSLLLAHHPDAFDQAARQGVDLTLSGHTHGGQVVLSNSRGKKGSIGLGSLAFQYPRGLYQRGKSYR
jgi:predicted MPP superfamily phosphohydrolase